VGSHHGSNAAQDSLKLPAEHELGGYSFSCAGYRSRFNRFAQRKKPGSGVLPRPSFFVVIARWGRVVS
jgi:hypothetical protein